ncbi:MAG: hypothetical protein ACR2PV_00210 [Gammaproteobacteria bacterium]
MRRVIILRAIDKTLENPRHQTRRNSHSQTLGMEARETLFR